MTSAVTTRRKRNNLRGFTLIELLVILVIIMVMVSVGVVSITSGKGAARVKGATRDVFGAIRHARSVALVTGKPAIITYSMVREDGEVMAKIEVTSAKLMDAGIDRSKVQTLSGEPLQGESFELVHIEKADKRHKAVSATEKQTPKPGSESDGEDETEGMKENEGESIEDILFSPINADVVRGMRIKVLKADEELVQTETVHKSKVSVFSNVDFLLGRFNESKKKEDEKKAQDSAGDDTDAADKDKAKEDDFQEPVSFVWETNGRVEPHQVWVYADGQKPESGLMIKIDRFGAAKVLSGDGQEDED